nr:unnamed protein product [Callosobruchus analis]
MVQIIKHNFPSLTIISEEKAACIENESIPSSLKSVLDGKLEQEVDDNEELYR